MTSFPENKNDALNLFNPENNKQLSIFLAPAPKKQKKQEIVLDEDKHINNIEKIITRDFFPFLHNLEKDEADTVLKNDNSSTIPPTEQTQNIDNMTLNEYLRKYNSEDNKSLEKLLDRDEDIWRKKHWWIHKAEQDHKSKQLAIENDNRNRIQNMVYYMNP